MHDPILYKSQLKDVQFGENVKVVEPVNMYGCTIGENSFIGPFCEIQKNVTIGPNCKIQSHTFICEFVEIGAQCFIGQHVCITRISLSSIRIC